MIIHTRDLGGNSAPRPDTSPALPEATPTSPDPLFEVDGIRLDPDNQEFKYALEFALMSQRNLYLTGKAGAGKTTFLKYLRKVSKKEMAVLAPTGVAAVNAGGQTIHSFFKIEPSLYVPGDKRLRLRATLGDPDKSTLFDVFRYSSDRVKLLRNLELLVIDEVSMVRADLLDVVDTLLRAYRGNDEPFGGVQVILIGDTFQLPPVVRGEDKTLLYRFYRSEYFFSAKVIGLCNLLYIELKKIYRQSERDFIDMLNRVRVGRMIQDDFDMLNSRFDPGFIPGESDKYITLATTNSAVTEVNGRKLAQLPTPPRTYVAEIEGDFPPNSRPTETELSLKVGSQVMFVKNNWGQGYYNGMIGTVKRLGGNQIRVEVDAPHGEKDMIEVEREEWENKVYGWNEEKKQIEEKIIGTFTQFPLRLAWAVTVHKSQGLTFDKVIADIGESFTSGQVYVALSRCTSLGGLVLTSRIVPASVKTDPRVLEFANNETPGTLLTEQLVGSKADYYYAEARRALRAHDPGQAFESFITAIGYRNDMGTGIFRRYVVSWLGRFFSHEEAVSELQKQHLSDAESIRTYESDVSSLRQQLKTKDDTIRTVNGQVRSLKSNVAAIQKEKGDMSAELTASQEKIREADQVHQQDQQMIDELKKENARLKAENVRLKAESVGLKKKTAGLNGELVASREEIKRLSSIKWWEKLFGKK